MECKIYTKIFHTLQETKSDLPKLDIVFHFQKGQVAILGGGDLYERKMGQKLDMKMTFLLRFTGTQFCHPHPAPIRSSLYTSHTHLRGDKSLMWVGGYV